MSLYARKYNVARKPVTPAALDALRRHSWPGNVRELSHAVERALILCDGDELDVGDFRLVKSEAGATTSLNLEENERRMVRQALEQAGGNISHAAAALGITRSALYRRIEKFDL